ncbi:MAG: cyclophilin-like fold protein [Candidatus Bathyarchaeota archaeon]
MSDQLSRIPIKITVVEKGEATGFLNRLTAPLTVGAVAQRLPINSRTSPAMGHVSILVNLQRGVEKPVTEVKAGTIAYWPRSDALTIYPKDTKPYGPVNKIGEIEENLELFDRLRSGSRVIIEKI